MSSCGSSTKAPVADLKDLYLSTDAELLEDYTRPEPAGLCLAVVDQLHSSSATPVLNLSETAQ